MGIQTKATAALAVAFSSLLAVGCGVNAPQSPNAKFTAKQILPTATDVTLLDTGHRGLVSLGVAGSIFNGITPADVLTGYPPLALSSNIGTANIVANQYLQAQTGGFSPYVLPASLQGTWLSALSAFNPWPGLLGLYGLGGLGLGGYGLGVGGYGLGGIRALGAGVWPLGVNPYAGVPVGHMFDAEAFWPAAIGIPFVDRRVVSNAILTNQAAQAAAGTPVVQQPVAQQPVDTTMPQKPPMQQTPTQNAD